MITNKQRILFRLKSTDGEIEESKLVVDTYLSPSTPVGQSGTFGALEPSVTTTASDFTVPTTDFKWNQIVELQLSDGRKVSNLFLRRKQKKTLNLIFL